MKFILVLLKILRRPNPVELAFILYMEFIRYTWFLRSSGLCFTLYVTKEWTCLTNELRSNVWPLWSKHSGMESYPVPGPEGVCAEKAYYSVPKWRGEYGRLRKELLIFSIEEMWKIRQESPNRVTY